MKHSWSYSLPMVQTVTAYLWCIQLQPTYDAELQPTYGADSYSLPMVHTVTAYL